MRGGWRSMLERAGQRVLNFFCRQIPSSLLESVCFCAFLLQTNISIPLASPEITSFINIVAMGILPSYWGPYSMYSVFSLQHIIQNV